ncbi:MAG: hypothetical protein IH945_13295, partial [Armatimonadetes bacterium]|nr:hypothetical protein [Armatimonadota bacterium]
FWGLATGVVETEDEYEHVLRDIQTLNEWAMEGRLESSAVSVHAFSKIADRYALLRHGGSFGEGYGPMIVAKREIPLDELREIVIAVPGELTSAFLQLHLWFVDQYAGGLPWGEGVEQVSGEARAEPLILEISSPALAGGGSSGEEPPSFDQAQDHGFSPEPPRPKFAVVPFDEIVPEIQEGKYEAGLIIHEGQLTWERDGMTVIADMGKWWQERTGGLPLPLGVNVVRKDLGEERCADISRCMRESIAAGLDNREKALDYALQFARDMDRATSDEFVGMYVNDRTRDMGEEGIKAIRLMLGLGAAIGMVPTVSVDVVD